MVWKKILNLYDMLEKRGDPICPIAHTYLTAHIGVLLDGEGNFLAAMRPYVEKELVPVPCTIQSEGRSRNPDPHLISDQLCYVSEMPGYEERHENYIKQLRNYVIDNPADQYAAAVWKYAQKNTLLKDIEKIIPKNSQISKRQLNIIFYVHGCEEEAKDLQWTEYYLSKLPKNGICSITGEPDHIPKTYPRDILYPSDRARLFFANNSSVTDLYSAAPGYVASQKIIHALQYMLYGQKNHERVEAEYCIYDYLTGRKTEAEFLEWAKEKCPGKEETLLKILNE